jgi:hypothetical protein
MKMTTAIQTMSDGRVTFVVLKTEVQNSVGRLAREHADFDAERRAVLIDRDGGVLEATYSGAAAVVLRPDGTVCGVMDRARALSEAWIEDAFVRSSRLPAMSDDYPAVSKRLFT